MLNIKYCIHSALGLVGAEALDAIERLWFQRSKSCALRQDTLHSECLSSVRGTKWVMVNVSVIIHNGRVHVPCSRLVASNLKGLLPLYS